MATSGNAPSHDEFFRPKDRNTVAQCMTRRSALKESQATLHGFRIEIDPWTSSWMFVSPAHHEKYQDQHAKKRHHLGFADSCNQVAGHVTLENLIFIEILACQGFLFDRPDMVGGSQGVGKVFFQNLILSISLIEIFGESLGFGLLLNRSGKMDIPAV